MLTSTTHSCLLAPSTPFVTYPLCTTPIPFVDTDSTIRGLASARRSKVPSMTLTWCSAWRCTSYYRYSPLSRKPACSVSVDAETVAGSNGENLQVGLWQSDTLDNEMPVKALPKDSIWSPRETFGLWDTLFPRTQLGSEKWSQCSTMIHAANHSLQFLWTWVVIRGCQLRSRYLFWIVVMPLFHAAGPH